MRTIIGTVLLTAGLVLASPSTGEAAGIAGPAVAEQTAAQRATSTLIEKVHSRRYRKRHWRRPHVYFNYGWGPRYYSYYRPYYERRYYSRPIRRHYSHRHYRHRHYRRHW